MKKTEKDYEYLETSPEAAARGLRRITRPKFLDKLPKKKALRDCKSRITIMLDADIIEHFKNLSEETGKGYQTLINQTLREAIEIKKPALSELKEELLKDKSFLESLKTALTI